MMMLYHLALLFLPAVIVASDNTASTAEDVLYEDVTTIRKELEDKAWKLLGSYHFLRRDTTTNYDVDAAGKVLQEAMAIAPWIPETYYAYASHLMDEHQNQTLQVMEYYRKAMLIQHALPEAKPKTSALDLMKQLHKRSTELKTFNGQLFPCRLKHDREQLALLGERGRLPQSVVDRYVKGYDELLKLIPDDKWEFMMTLPPAMWAKTIGPVYQRALYVPAMEPMKGPVLNPNLDFRALEEAYLNHDPNFCYFDELLTEEALLKLRQYYEEATIFYDNKPGYVGAYMFDGGFGNPIVAQLVNELIDAFPRIICSHKLNHAWAYKYDSEIENPIAAHADVAAVNFNFWISPDEGSLNKNTGGLVVFRAIPPEGTPLEVYNHLPLHENVTKMLAETNFYNVTVPFKTNRAVVFQSNLFHQSDVMHWAPGYTKRRINLTLLFGKMYEKCKDNSDEKDPKAKEEL